MLYIDIKITTTSYFMYGAGLTEQNVVRYILYIDIKITTTSYFNHVSAIVV
jgi:hypothetical protein